MWVNVQKVFSLKYTVPIRQNIWLSRPKRIQESRTMEGTPTAVREKCEHTPAHAKALWRGMSRISGNGTVIWDIFTVFWGRRWVMLMYCVVIRFNCNIRSNPSVDTRHLNQIWQCLANLVVALKYVVFLPTYVNPMPEHRRKKSNANI